jgi:hypothetical protein
MSDFIINNEDFIDFIKNEEDLKKFKRLKEIWESGELHKPAKDCLDLVIEFDNFRRDLRGEERHRFIKLGDPKLN